MYSKIRKMKKEKLREVGLKSWSDQKMEKILSNREEDRKFENVGENEGSGYIMKIEKRVRIWKKKKGQKGEDWG